MQPVFRSLALLAGLALACPAHAQADNAPPNFDFSEGLKNWRTRTEAPASAYTVTAAEGDAPAEATLTVTGDDPVMNREAIYFSRPDLPVEAGYYRLDYEISTRLKAGTSVVTIGAFAEKERLLASFNSAAEGVPPARGETDWTPGSFVYQVPAGAVMVIMQLELKSALGSASFRNLKLTKLDADMGKRSLESQKNRLTFPPFKPVPARTPQFPLKTRRMIYTPEQVALARSNVEKYPAARKLRDDIVKAADEWLTFTNEELRGLMPDGRVPRGFDLSPKGCPVHGIEVFKHGTYPWTLDLRKPLQVKCPVGGEVYPSNDYAAWYKSGQKGKVKQDGPYTDDGWGWEAPDGERYWFVAYANHWTWTRHVIPGINMLSRAWVLTGDRRYAHKAAVMLHRLAEVYPAMDHANQSRYGALMRAQGGEYPGKIANHIWETFQAKYYAEAYDNIWDSIDGDTALQAQLGKSGEQIRSFIEANLLEDAVDAYFQGKIEGNYGMHQNALLHILLARQTMDNAKYFDLLVNDPGADWIRSGLSYALFNSVYRDGLGVESPGYSASWVDNFVQLAELLTKGGFDLFAERRLKMLMDAQINNVMIGRFTPDWGDSGDAMGAVIGVEPDTYRIGYHAYKEPRYLPWLASIKKTGPEGFTTFPSLFQPELPPTAPLPGGRVVAPQRSRLQAGFGLGLLNNRADTTGLALTYGYHGSHYHWDFLNFEMFANGTKIMPDLGYPDAMNEFVQEIFTWSTNTIAHNTVVVDGRRQDVNQHGTLHSFSEGAFARSIDASAQPYSQTSQYRRNMVMVDVDGKQSYTVDFFRVAGGRQHDYSLHGPPGETSIINGKFGAVQPGTLAGPNVKLGEIYDDATLGAEGYSGRYNTYKGSGFQYLYNVRRQESGVSTVQYQHLKEKASRLRIHMLPANPQEVFLADAWDKPRARAYEVKFVIARRRAQDDKPLASTFVSVLEPYAAESYIQSTKLLPVSGGGHAVEVKRAGATDIIISDTANAAKKLTAWGIATDANSAVVTLGPDGSVQRAFFSDGSYLRCKGHDFKAAPVEGIVTGVDTAAGQIEVRLEPGAPLSSAQLKGRVAHFTNSLRTTVFQLDGATGSGASRKLKVHGDLLVGRAFLKNVEGTKLGTETTLGFAGLYGGATLLNAARQPVGTIKEVQGGEIRLTEAPPIPLSPNSDVWIAEVGAGEKVTIRSAFSWTQPAAKPAAKPAVKPASKPAAGSAARPAAKPKP